MRLRVLIEKLSTLLKYINYYKQHTKYVKTRADGSAWYERSIRNRKIAGSNPAQSINTILKGFGRFWVWESKLLTKNCKFGSSII